jgi:hypothetical protein
MLARRWYATPTASAILTSLLAIAFVISCVLLISHVLTGPKLEYSVAGELLLVAVLSVEGIVAVRHLRQSRLDSVHQVLVTVLQDYRSAEMMLAINSLWRFRREHGEKFVQAYLDRWQRDDERIAGLPEDQQLEATTATLHYRRRIVKEFFNLLAGLHELGVFPKDVLETYWGPAELKIIPEILIPLETAVSKNLRTEQDFGGWFQRLNRLSHHDIDLDAYP